MPNTIEPSGAAPLGTDQILLIAAMPEELQGHFERAGISVVYTGLGKVNATYRLMHALSEWKTGGRWPRAVVNFGTAGSSKFKTHELVEITHFVQRDMDVTPLGFALGTTPFDLEAPVVEVQKCVVNLPSGSCGTGDNFEVAHPETQFAGRDEASQSSFFDLEVKSLLLPYYDVVDMEAYALAKVCAFEKIRFVSIKYISDGADPGASGDWAQNLPLAAAQFFKIYPTLAHLLGAPSSP